MAITSSVGYGGSIDETEWARMASLLGASYGVVGPDDWRVTTVPAADRTVAIAAGTGWGRGVRDINDGPVTLQGDVVATGSRWDLVVARRDWELDGGKTTFEIVKGGATKQLPAGRLVGPGVLDDQPIALVRFTAGQQLPTELVDLRCWPGNGGLVAVAMEALAYLDDVGSRVSVGGFTWERRFDPQGAPAWLPPLLSVDSIPELPAERITSGTLSRLIENTASGNKMGRLTLTGAPSTSQRPNMHITAAGLIYRSTHVEEEQTGQVLVSFTSRTFHTVRVNFAQGRFSGTPVVTVNINSSAAEVAQWGARATAIDQTGFTLFVFSGFPDNTGVSPRPSAWSSIPVQWNAVRKP